MTKEALRLALQMLEIEEAQTHYPSQCLLKAITAIKESLAHPPQRTWQGLTDEEILDKCESVPDYDIGNRDLIQFARAIEAKLKEKNNVL